MSKLSWQFNLGKGMSEAEIDMLCREIKGRRVLTEDDIRSVASLIEDMYDERQEAIAICKKECESRVAALQNELTKELVSELPTNDQHIVRSVVSAMFEGFDFELDKGIR